MNDVKEIREALDKLSVIAPRPIGDPERSEWDKARHLERKAARAYVELVESGALIIKKGGNNQWPKWVVDTFKSTSDPRWALDMIVNTLAAVVPVEANDE